MRTTIQRLLRSEEGATTAEYGFLIVLCTGAALAAILILDQSVQTLASKARERMGEVDGSPASAASAPAAAPSSDDRGRRGRGWGPGKGRGWGRGGNAAGGNPPPKTP